MSHPDPEFPPLLTGHSIPGRADPLLLAKEGILKEKYGAGDVLWSKSHENVELAIVLEPEVALGNAVQMIPLTMVACGDCLGVLTPPQVGVTFHWPNVIKVNDGSVGEVRAIASATDSGEVPDWLIVGLKIRLRHSQRNFEPGDDPSVTALAEEGCADLTRSEFIDSFTRHFLTWINHWNDEGFKPVHAAWLYRTTSLNENITVNLRGDGFDCVFLGLDENGNLLGRTENGQVCNRNLAEILENRGIVGDIE